VDVRVGGEDGGGLEDEELAEFIEGFKKDQEESN